MPFDGLTHFNFLSHYLLKQCNLFCVFYSQNYFNQLNISTLILLGVISDKTLDDAGCHWVII